MADSEAPKTKSNKNVPPPTAPLPTSHDNKLLYALIVLLLAVPVSFFSRRGYNTELSGSYALCTPHKHGVYTVDANNTRTQCVVVHENRIVNTGSLNEVRRHWHTALHAPGTKLNIRWTPKGSIIVPGIADSHAHIMEYGAARQTQLEGAKTVEEAVQRVRAFVESRPDYLSDKHRTILLGGWNHMGWENPVMPSSADLENDFVLKGRKIILQSKDCHALWVSSATLNQSLPFPEKVAGGFYSRDASGKPAGVLMDDAQKLLKWDGLNEADKQLYFDITMKDALSYGITSIHDAGLSPDSYEFFKKQAEKGILPLRIYAMRYFDKHADLSLLGAPVIGAGNGRLTSRSVKIFSDGALRTGGAALHHHYHGLPSDKGIMLVEPELLYKVIPALSENGWQVNVHAIGDRANSIVLDAFERSLKNLDADAVRHRLEHAQMMTSEDIRRLGRLGLIASIQPAHVIGDMGYAEERVGPDRIKRLYPFRSIIDSGARIALGTDFPVEEMNPFNGFYAALTRLSHEGTSPHGPNGWFPEQRLTRTEALRGMTIDPAYASFTEKTSGSLEDGKLADFAVYSQNFMEVSVEKIMNTKTLATFIDGVRVYGTI